MLTAWLLLDQARANAEAMDPADLPPLPVALMVFGALLALSFFFSGTETAFFSLQDRDRRRYAEGETLTDRRIDALLEKRTGLITTILMGNEFVNVTFSSFSAALVALVKPQFEAGPGRKGKDGVLDETLARRIAEGTAEALDGLAGFRVAEMVTSPVKGGDGNREFLLLARRT
jgi:hypothetical protein